MGRSEEGKEGSPGPKRPAAPACDSRLRLFLSLARSLHPPPSGVLPTCSLPDRRLPTHTLPKPLLGFYFAVISASSIGYGDLAPATPAARWLATATLPLAVVLLNARVNEIAQDLAERSFADHLAQVK